MRGGAKPKPLALRELQGRQHKARTGGAPRVARPQRVPYAPRHLCAEGQHEWRHMARWLLDAGLYTNGDHAALELYCEAYGQWLRAKAELEKEGAIVLSDKGNQVYNLWQAVADKRFEQVRRMLGEFGLTPAERSRIVAGQEPEKSLAEILFQKAAEDDAE